MEYTSLLKNQKEGSGLLSTLVAFPGQLRLRFNSENCSADIENTALCFSSDLRVFK